MGYRVDRIHVLLDVYIEFEGVRLLEFDYVPTPGDPLAEILMAKNDELKLAEARAKARGGDLFLGG